MTTKITPGVWLLMASVFILTIGSSIFLWYFLRNNAERTADRVLSSASETLQDRVQAELDQQTNAVQRLANKWQVRPEMDRTEWDYDVKQILEDHPSLLALAWIENVDADKTEEQLAADKIAEKKAREDGLDVPQPTPEQIVRHWAIGWSQPPIYEPAVKKLHGLVQQNRLRLLGEVISDRRMKITDAIFVADRGKAFAAYAPSIVDGKIKGAVMGVFHLQILMDSVFEKLLSQDFSVEMLDGYQAIYQRGKEKNRPADWEHNGNLKIFGSTWQMRLWPNPEVQAANESNAMKALLGGIALSFFLTGLIFVVASRSEISHVAVIPDKKGENSDLRRKMEDRLRVWESAISNVNEAIFVAESEKVMGSGTPILFVNEAFTKLTGLTSAELVGKTTKGLFPTAAAAKLGDSLREAMTHNQAFSLDLPLTRKDQEPVEAELRLKPVVDTLNRTTHWICLLKEKVAPLTVEATMAPAAAAELVPALGEPVLAPVTLSAAPQTPAISTAALLEALLADTPLAVQVFDEDGQILSWNKLAEDVTGWSAAELLGKSSPVAVKKPGIGVWHRQNLKLRRKDGMRMDLNVWTAPLRDPEREDAPVSRWMSFMADVTQETLAQEQLTERESNFRSLVENASDILAVLDLDSTLKYINPAVEQVLGMKPEDLLGTKTTDLVQASDTPAALKSMEEAKLGLGPSRARTMHVRHQDGSLREIESVINLIQGSNLAVMNARDVTGRSRSEMPEVSPAWFLNAVQDAIVTFDSQYRVIWMNRAAEDVYNLATAFAQGKTIGELMPEWLQVPSREQIRESLESEGFWKGEVSNYTPSGREIVQDVSLTATFDSEQRRNGAVAIYRDITEKKKAVETFRADETTKTLNTLGNSDGLWDWNMRTDEVYFSPRWKEMLGYADEEIAGDLGEWYMMVHPDDLPMLRNRINGHLKGQAEHLEAEYRIRTKSGGHRWMMTRAMAVRNAEGEATRLVGLQTDIHSQKEMEEQLLFEAFHDSTTGLANRALFLDRVNGMLARGNKPFAVAFMDLARFADVNETLGTRGGDKALAEAGRRITEFLPKDSFVARHGSDEFVALVNNTGESNLRALADLLRYHLAKPYEYQGKTVSIKLNVGFATSDSRHYGSGEDMLQDASRAMAGSKLGKIESPVFTPAVAAVILPAEGPTESLSEALSLEAEMRRAMANDEFRVFYHPIITLDTGEIAGVEALVRWQHPERGLMLPKDFLGVAESSGYIFELDRWVLREACAKAFELNARFHRVEPLVLTVNLSSRHFADNNLTGHLEEILETSAINPRYLRIELNERILQPDADSDTVLANLGRLRVQLSLDDYNESADALHQFHRLPIDRVKLDSSLIRGLATGRNIEKVRAIITAAKGQNMQVVAEGVETLEQLAVLRELKCHLAQGFYFTQPASANDTERLLARSPRW